MAQRGNVYEARSDPTQHFLLAQGPGVSQQENIPLPQSIGAGGNGRGWIRQIHLLSLDNLAWEVIFYGSSQFETADPSTNFYLARYRFQAAHGLQVTPGGLYHYIVDDLSLPYEDHDRPQDVANLHVMLINRTSVASKTAGPNTVLLQVLMENASGW